ncbi:hypothetical protein [Gelidibacter japonicus]|jgi:hypothetical protein|uniref:hypothetical protein n=1 Tax=Gelidibacter japonicus TaxID=1962232 RepID=UPI0013D34C71|nr:hypothetical protein [Gelidibacter japonicus]MCL8008510.1 hypothetical protein [Gelidibacter japonicus]
MKKLLTLALCLSLSNIALSQDLDIVLLENLTTKSFASSDKYMIDYYGFEKIRNNKDNLQNTYGRTYKHDLDNTIVITVMSSNDTSNELDVSLAKNYKVQEIKDKLVSQGYTYTGLENFEFSEFKKDKSVFLVSEIPNEDGKTQVKVISE